MSFLDSILDSMASMKDGRFEKKNEEIRKRPAEVAKLPTIDEEYRRLKKQKLENAKKAVINKPETKQEALEVKSAPVEIKNSKGLSLSERTAAILKRSSREEKLPPNPLITDAETAKRAAKEISQHKVISSDLEWSGSKRECTLAVVQVATPDNVYLFDIYVGGEAIFQSGLKDILESKTILKVFHDCRWDSDVLFHQYKVRLDNVFDTQLGYAVFCRQQSNYTPLPVSLNSLSLENIEDREAFKDKNEEKKENNETAASTTDNNDNKARESNNGNEEKKETTEQQSPIKNDTECNTSKNEATNKSPEKVRSVELDLTKEKSPEKEPPVTPNGTQVKYDRPLPKYGIPSWDKDCLISIQRQQNRRRK